MNLDQLLSEAKKMTAEYQKKAALGADEELQMLACAYTTLFLEVCANKSKKEIGQAHDTIAKCFDLLGDKNWSARHTNLADAYSKLS